ncbi:MAG: Uma2 family endonuclease [Lewinellaceae bacterium]|nr:Uma2 family endonuclease [Lewinellaceae bacterium]
MDAAAVKSEYELERDKPVPSKNHAIVQGNLHFLIRSAYGKRYTVLPEVSIIISSREKVPDIAIYPSMEFTPGEDETRLENAPLGVIEILSPSQSLAELIAKSAAYFEGGVLSYSRGKNKVFNYGAVIFVPGKARRMRIAKAT